MRVSLAVTVMLAGVAWACTDSAVDGAVDAAERADATSSGRIVVAASDGYLEVDLSVSITGDGSDRVGAISVLNGSGSFDVLGAPVAVAVYEEQPWPEAGYTLYQGLAVAADRWYVTWFYCAGASLEYVYLEGTDGTRLGYEPASGTCSMGAGPSSIAVEFPAVDMPWPEAPEAVGRFTIMGTDLVLDGLAPGMVRLDGSQWVLLPFEYVNCTGGCEVGTWYELHALLWDESAGRAAFAIFYMTLGDPTSVVVEYLLSIPDLTAMAGGTTFVATWSYGPA